LIATRIALRRAAVARASREEGTRRDARDVAVDLVLFESAAEDVEQRVLVEVVDLRRGASRARAAWTAPGAAP